MRRYLCAAVLSLSCLVVTGAARAAYPERPIRWVVATPPGGSLDVVARILAEKLRTSLQQTIVVENRAGAAGSIAAQSVASSAPDGYTVLMTTTAMVINAWMSPTSLDPIKDLQAVTRVALSPYVLVVGPSLPVTNLDEFIAYAKKEPGKLTCSTYGVGSPPHLALEAMKRAGELNIVHAPYRGFGQALPDLMSGLLSCSVDTPANVAQHVRAGTIKAIAVTSPKALEMFPGAMPMAERYPDVEVVGWQGVFVPANTPQPIVDKINEELVKVISEPEVIKRLRDIGFDPVGDSSASAAAIAKTDYDRYGGIIKALNLKSE
ncbi:tripartite tricarboxylate transporter substrate binding protein [Tardiphaga sp.]|uniref:Bug family tripartite tricarboxylate transporter substrate binding protein n=1 Tax=Tardiphaga sp. TaxID=1926292 RepID=UPI00260583B0|nr:tripartite tricarboxylate transporter substrate binding protein [Tardiphaga sp.]MDB5619903.1 tripartite tricarboxylate transporter substrate binding protein [Tardiphaga sp.]